MCALSSRRKIRTDLSGVSIQGLSSDAVEEGPPTRRWRWAGKLLITLLALHWLIPRRYKMQFSLTALMHSACWTPSYSGKTVYVRLQVILNPLLHIGTHVPKEKSAEYLMLIKRIWPGKILYFSCTPFPFVISKRDNLNHKERLTWKKNWHVPELVFLATRSSNSLQAYCCQSRWQSGLLP